MSKLKAERIVITGVGFTSPLGNSLSEIRSKVLNSESGIKHFPNPYWKNLAAGVCSFDPLQFQTKKILNRGTRNGSIATFCANRAIIDSKIPWSEINKNRVAIILGIAEHGSNQTALEMLQFISENNKDISLWSPYHAFRIISNSPSGEVSCNLKITGPHFTVSSACSSSNLAIIQGVQQILLGEVDYAICGGVSDILESFVGFASFAAQGALATHDDASKASRPLDKNRTGVVLSEGGGLFFIEKLSDAKKRKAHIYAEIESFHYNSDAHDYSLPLKERQVECMKIALEKASLNPNDIDLVNLHATGTLAGDVQECSAVRDVFNNSSNTFFNSSKGAIGHSMGASSILEMICNLSSFSDNLIHPTINIDELDPECFLSNLVLNKSMSKNINRILKNSFGMMGANSCLVYKKFV